MSELGGMTMLDPVDRPWGNTSHPCQRTLGQVPIESMSGNASAELFEDRSIRDFLIKIHNCHLCLFV